MQSIDLCCSQPVSTISKLFLVHAVFHTARSQETTFEAQQFVL